MRCGFSIRRGALGKPEIAGTWTEKSLLEQIASAQEAAGDKVLALLTRLRILSPGRPDGSGLRGGLARPRRSWATGR